MPFWKTLVVIGVISLLLSSVLIGLSIYESWTIPVQKDRPVGEFLIVPLLGAGLIAIGLGVAYKRQS
jgi:hypothetical protein